MARGNGWRSGVLTLLLILALAAVPAGAGERRGAQGTVVAGWGWIGEVWRSIVERIVPLEWREKLGPEMDPDGLMAQPGSQGTPAVPASAGGDLGPGMDPDGRH